MLSAEEMVIEYRSAGDGWTVTARLADPLELGATVFAVLTGDAALEDGGRRRILDRRARGLTGPWKPTGTTQTLWIDEVTLVPLLWQVAATQDPPAPDEGLYFVYDRSIDIRPPSNVVDAGVPAVTLLSVSLIRQAGGHFNDSFSQSHEARGRSRRSD